MQTVSTCLWFDHQALEAAEFYVSLFPNSRVLEPAHDPAGGPRPAGPVLAVRFTLDGVEYMGLNGGPHYQLTPAASLVAQCDDQSRMDELWEKLVEGGRPSRCGWLVDRYGLSWQIVPRQLGALLGSEDRAAAKRAMDAMLKMEKLDLAALQRAHAGA